MILIVTLNPLLERRYINPEIIIGEVNRNADLTFSAGGKGINVSRQLKNIGLNSFNFIFSGGKNGKILREIIKNENLEFSFVSTKSETREACIAISKNDKKVTSVFTSNPQVTIEEVEEFKLKLDRMIQNCEIVIFSGSSPSAETNSIIPFGIQAANKYDKVSICDTYGENLNECIDSSPTIMHNNISEIESSLSIELNSEDSLLEFLNELKRKNIKRIYLTNGDKEFYASNFGYNYKINSLSIDAIDPTGSGDSFVAGLVYSWVKQEIFVDSLKFATALAASNAESFDVCNVKLENARKYLDRVAIFPIGKKVKLIDDSPHEI